MRGEVASRMRRMLPQLFFAVVVLWLVLAGIYRACFVWLTPMREEVSLLHYIAWLVDQKNYIPYQDVFETAFPGTFIFHQFIGRLLGYSDTAFHVFDWLWLSGLLFVTWHILKVFSNRVAWVGSAAFFALYFAQGAAMTLQRDYVGILPVAISLLLTMQREMSLYWRSAAVGFFMAAAAWMKPHMLVATPVIAWMLLRSEGFVHAQTVRNNVAVVFVAIVGACACCAFVFLWLYSTGGLEPFWRMLSQYLPVYMGDEGIRSVTWAYMRLIEPMTAWVDQYIPADLGGKRQISGGIYWQLMNAAGHLLEKFFAWMVLIVAGVWRGFSQTVPRTPQRQLLVALLALCVLFFLYPVFANKYWNYHWMPYRYFALLCGSLLLLPTKNNSAAATIFTAISSVGFVWLFSGKLPPPNGETIRQTLTIWREQGFKQQRYPEEDLAAYLTAHLRVGDKVQIIDEGGFAPRALLLAQALPATQYLTYRQLLVNAGHPVVLQMREDFIRHLQSAPPRFIVDTHSAPSATFSGAPYQFSEMDGLLKQRYHKVIDQCNENRCFLTVWERTAL